jgi:hypothetical protein
MKKRNLLLFAAAVLASIIFYAYYQFNRKPESTSEKEAIAALRADSLAHLFESNDSIATLTYAGKIIQVEGTVIDKSSENGTVRLHLKGTELSNLICQLEPRDSALFNTVSNGATICLKGQCNTYQKVDLLPGGDLLISNCIWIEKEK